MQSGFVSGFGKMITTAGRVIRRRGAPVLRRMRFELGQTTAEYALVLLGAAAVAIVLITWATENESIKNFFEAILAELQSSVGAGD